MHSYCMLLFSLGNDLFGEDEPDEDEDTPLTKGSGLFSGGGGGGLFDDDVVEEQVRKRLPSLLGLTTALSVFL